ncbi:MAG: tripartite tricarboxylate transporter substrate binding protein [Betaproteobacteria bacterium]|nr:tripartite tricarboxylate transporter substrate binding protein [Betaproteobacteria bacterium]
MEELMRKAKTLLSLIFLSLGTALSLPAAAGYPEKPVRLIVPFPAGGPTDAMARVVAQKLSINVGQQFIVDNIGGAGGAIAAQSAARAAPDGYTLFFGTTGTLAINPALYSKLAYNPQKDFLPISLVANSANMLLVHPSVPAASVKELVANARANPGKLTFGSAGNGSSNHLSGELLKTMAGIDMVHVPYKGTAPAMNDLLGGRLSMMFDTVITGMQHVKNGKLRALGVTSPTRSSVAPDLPTISEAGVPGFEVTIWFGILAPAETPKDIVATLQREIAKAVQSPDIKEKFASMGAEAVGSNGEQFALTIRNDLVKWAKVVKDSGARID